MLNDEIEKKISQIKKIKQKNRMTIKYEKRRNDEVKLKKKTNSKTIWNKKKIKRIRTKSDR